MKVFSPLKRFFDHGQWIYIVIISGIICAGVGQRILHNRIEHASTPIQKNYQHDQPPTNFQILSNGKVSNKVGEVRELAKRSWEQGAKYGIYEALGTNLTLESFSIIYSNTMRYCPFE